MEIPLLTRLSRSKRKAISEEESILLADFDLHPARTINVTPEGGEPPAATVVVESSAAGPEPAREAVPDQLRSVVEKLASAMLEAWSDAVRDMHAILAADHAKLEAAAAEMRHATDQLACVSEELTQIRRRVAALEKSVDDARETERALRGRLDAQARVLREVHSATEAQAARVRDVAAAVKRFGKSLVE